MTVLHKYAAFWQAKRPLYQAGDVLLVLVTGGLWLGWLAGELLLVSVGYLKNDGTDALTQRERETHDPTTTDGA